MNDASIPEQTESCFPLSRGHAMKLAVKAALLGRARGVNWHSEFSRACVDGAYAKVLFDRFSFLAAEESKSLPVLESVKDILFECVLIDGSTLRDLMAAAQANCHPYEELDPTQVASFIRDHFDSGASGPQPRLKLHLLHGGRLTVTDASDIIGAWLDMKVRPPSPSLEIVNTEPAQTTSSTPPSPQSLGGKKRAADRRAEMKQFLAAAMQRELELIPILKRKPTVLRIWQDVLELPGIPKRSYNTLCRAWQTRRKKKLPLATS
jgi:hypothetical protein